MVNSPRSLTAVIMTFLGIKVILSVQNFPGVQRQQLLWISSPIPIVQDEVKGLHPTSHGSHSEDFLYPFLFPLLFASLCPSLPCYPPPCYVALSWPWYRMYGNTGKAGKVSMWFLILNLEWNQAIALPYSQLFHFSTANSPALSLMYSDKCFLGASLPWLIFSLHFNMAGAEKQAEVETK